MANKKIGNCCFVTAERFEIDPVTTKVYFYPDWAKDRIAHYGLMNFDNTNRKWTDYYNDNFPIFLEIENVHKY